MSKLGISEIMTLNTLKLFMAEAIGTMLLVLIGCMGCLPGWAYGAPPHLQLCLSFGIAVMFVIQIFGHISGAHINPSVTLCGVIWGALSIPMALVYFIAQMIGAVVGYGLLQITTPEEAFAKSTSMCVTIPDPLVNLGQAVLIEVIVTSVLILLTCAIWDPVNSHNSDSVPIKFGLTIAGLAIVAGPYTGASMNPARSFAPALWNNNWKHHWVYWVGPLLGSAVSAGIFHNFFRKPAVKKETRDILLEKVTGTA